MEPIVTPTEMAAVDAAAPEPVEVLIERAGWATAREAIDLLGGTYGRRVVVLAGKGNNGADGRSAARHLRRRGVRVTVLDTATVTPGDVLPPADLLIDAAFGTGFRGTWTPPEPGTTPVLAVDVPSGVSGLTGEAAGAPWAAVRTVTFAALKPGLLLGDGATLAGEVVVVDIGLDTSGASAHRVRDEDVAAWWPTERRDTHKWQHAAWIVAGSPGMTGAARLAVAGAQRAGAGYVRLSTPGVDPADPATVAGAAPVEAVRVALPAAGWAAVVADGAERFAALAVGPGLGADGAVTTGVRELVASTTRPIVVDGDGLRALGREAATVIGRRPSGAGPVVLTPHDGEHALLTGAAPGADRFEAARALARTTGAVVLLKGPCTVVADPDGAVLVADAGDRRLATAGTGDVLTGIVTALLAQGVPALRAAALAAHLHGRAGALGPVHGLVASDLPAFLPRVIDDCCGPPTSTGPGSSSRRAEAQR
ncbi:MAG: NAD(P)H-hydrate dehydratase [Actinobacteria bacterium]|nr:NAD(P)H-hydrate dehydratase [Actinomycetota bacterium]